jgi:glutathionyl-hydroquinone reductase
MSSGSVTVQQPSAVQSDPSLAEAAKRNQHPTKADGSYDRQISSFRNWIQEGGEFPPEKGKRKLASAWRLG